MCVICWTHKVELKTTATPLASPSSFYWRLAQASEGFWSRSQDSASRSFSSRTARHVQNLLEIPHRTHTFELDQNRKNI